MLKSLFYISQNYSFEILRPLQKEIISRGGEVRWLVIGNEVNMENFKKEEDVTTDINLARNFEPQVCYVPGNVIPNFIPGIKVQVFHGLEYKKKGHFVIRGYFDLYCTHGPATTEKFQQLAEQHGHFDVVETGWPKLDPLFSTAPYPHKSNAEKVILYAPTFSPSLTSAPELFEQIYTLSQQHPNWLWLIKFHPKMDKQWINRYLTLTADNVEIVQQADISSLLQCADIMISDTSSVIGEFALLNKPVITLNNSAPGDYLIDIQAADELPSAIETAFTPNDRLLTAIDTYAQSLHPYVDGQSSARILDAVEHMIEHGKSNDKPKPLNLFRNLKQRKSLNYWSF